MSRWIAAGLLIVSILSFCDKEQITRKEKLSEYGFFKGRLADLEPEKNIIPYSLNTPLFSNYAEKLRFIKVPDGEKALYNDSTTFDFPVGTVLIKNFYYPKDFRKPSAGRRILETRLLVNLDGGWEAWPYIWNDEQTEAVYDPAGEMKTVEYTDRSGRRISTNYAIPNKNQCKGCHIRGKDMRPIGLTARQLNANHPYSSGKENQLAYWQRAGILHEIVIPGDSVPRLAVWDDPSTGDVTSRARAYLEANCAHCHSWSGPASTSGLFLNIDENDASHFGVNKAPVAAGRGAGDLQFDIVPGEPQKSILVFRMKTNDPAIAMPEIGREQVHKEGVALIEAWIRSNTFKNQ